jgi:4-hydroxy-L-threonine phosphate dehydrogenase PdxA
MKILNSKSNIISLAVTPGCENGVGPELMVRAIYQMAQNPNLKFYWCSSPNTFYLGEERAQICHKNSPSTINKLQKNIIFSSNKDRPKHFLPAQAQSIVEAISLAKRNEVDAIITGPIRKNAIATVFEKNFCGQTEIFHHHLGQKNLPAFMAFVGGPFLLGLLTAHIPLKNISQSITRELLDFKLQQILKAATKYYNLSEQDIRIGVLGLNPHAGEDGLLGYEEKEIISPMVEHWRKKNININGPLAADGFFGYLNKIPNREMPHALLACYHDQGLIPYKILGQGNIANVTFGLKVPRTSPAHGTADLLVGKNSVCLNSTLFAFKTAIKLATS